MTSGCCPSCHRYLGGKIFSLKRGKALGHQQPNVVQCPHCSTILVSGFNLWQVAGLVLAIIGSLGRLAWVDSVEQAGLATALGWLAVGGFSLALVALIWLPRYLPLQPDRTR